MSVKFPVKVVILCCLCLFFVLCLLPKRQQIHSKHAKLTDFPLQFLKSFCVAKVVCIPKKAENPVNLTSPTPFCNQKYRQNIHIFR